MATSAANALASGDTAYLYRATIGPRGQDYYLRHFARFDGDGRAGTSWNWAAYWSTLNWMIYRRMWGGALAYVAAVLGLVLLIFGVGKLVLDYSDTSAWLLFLALLTAAFVVPGLYANAWYYAHCNAKISGVLRHAPDVKEAATVLASQAPDSRRLLWLGVANAVVLALVLSVVSWFQGAESALPQLAARDDRPPAGGSSGPVRPLLPSQPVARVASAPLAVASAPAVMASAPSLTASAPTVAPRVAEAASVAAPASALPVAAPAAAGKSPIVNAVDRAPARAPGTVASAPAPVKRVQADTAPAPLPAASAVAPRPAPRASAPRLHYVWVIQVGAYAEPANAQNALAQVQAMGLEAGAESFESPQGPLTRVRVGPYTRQAEAEQAALRIKTLNLPVLVIRQRP